MDNETRRAAVALAAVLALPAGRGHAAPLPATEQTKEVTWQDVVGLLDRHPGVVAGGPDVDAARAAVDAAGAADNPGLDASTGWAQGHEGDASRVAWELEVSVPLGWIVQRRPRRDAASAEVGVASAEAAALRRELLSEARWRFWSLVHDQERVAALAELDRQTAGLAQTVRRRVDNGEARPVEALRVEVEAERLAGELEAARWLLHARRRRLALWLGAGDGPPPAVVGDLTALPRPPAAEVARRKAAASHPEVAAARARVTARRADVDVERTARLPSLSLGAFAAHELDSRAWGIGLSVDLPVWNRNEGPIAASERRLAAARRRLEARRLGIEAEAVEAQAACEAAVRRATRFRERIVPRARTAAATVERIYGLGEAPLLDLIDARRTLTETRVQHLATLARAQADCGRLADVVGEELP